MLLGKQLAGANPECFRGSVRISHGTSEMRVNALDGLHDDEFDLDVVPSRPGVRTDLVRLFDEFFCLCLVDARKMDIKLDRELKFIVELTECDMTRYLDITELFVLLAGHKTNRTGETCGVAGSKQLLGI